MENKYKEGYLACIKAILRELDNHPGVEITREVLKERLIDLLLVKDAELDDYIDEVD